MIIKQLIDEDFINYKKASMFIGFPTCTFKCEKDAKCKGMCQNSELYKSPDIEISIDSICDRYINNPLTTAIVCGGLEPFDSFDDLYELIKTLRLIYKCDDDIVVYTGYYDYEIKQKLIKLQVFKNIIIKYGRYIPNKHGRIDEVLGIKLVSDNQYAEILKPNTFRTKIVQNTDIKLVETIKESLENNDGYCPCRVEKTSDTKCMCKEFKDSFLNNIETECHCGLYYSIIVRN